MEPYKTMYFKLFNKVTDLERQLTDMAKELRDVQRECEEAYINAPEIPMNYQNKE